MIDFTKHCVPCWERHKKISTVHKIGLCHDCFYSDNLPTGKTKQSHSQSAKNSWANPETRALRTERLRAAWRDPVIRARRLTALRAAMARPEVRARQSEGQRRSWNDTESKARQRQRARAGKATRGRRGKS